MANRLYEPGDFIKSASPDTFYVYEGRERVNPSNGTKRFTLLAYFTPNKFFRANDGWVSEEFLDVESLDHEVEFDLLADHEDFSYHVVDGEEKEACIKVLLDHGYEWHEETKSISKVGEEGPHYMPRIPSYEYNGEVVSVNNGKVREVLVEYARKKTEKKKTTTYNGNPQYASANAYTHNPYFNGTDEDWYDD